MDCYTLFSGSSGNCIYVKEGENEILIDAGANCKKISLALSSIGTDLSRISAVLLTHEHIDHVAALPVVLNARPVPVYCQEKVAKEIYFGYQMHDKPKWAENFAKCVRTVEPDKEYEIGDLVFAPFRTPHDSVDSEGFVLQEGKLGIATDLGFVSPEVRRALLGCENVILEANHDLEMLWNGSYPYQLKERVASDTGHLNNDASAAFAVEMLSAGCGSFTLFHLSAENNTPLLARDAYLARLSEAGAREGREYTLKIAQRSGVTKVL